MQKRSVGLAIVLSIVTCGIYAIYWLYTMTNDVHELVGRQTTASGGMAVLYTFITCGIYSFFWMYKMGGKVDNIKAGMGNASGSMQSSVLFLILNLLGLGIVNYCLMQDTINKVSM